MKINGAGIFLSIMFIGISKENFPSREQKQFFLNKHQIKFPSHN